MTDLLVVGAGAAGLWAAERAAREGMRVVLLEKTPRAGTKILASGGTRCNLTTTLSPDQAARLFGAAERFIQPALRALTPGNVRHRFAALGVPTVTEPAWEKVFPESQRAVDVRDALLRAARASGVVVRCNAAVTAIEPEWAVHTATEILRAPRLILCAGGKSYPRTGTTGDGYAWLRALDLPVVDPVPALVPLRSPAGWVRELSGISLQDTEARLVDASGKVIGRRARPVLFTHTGLSGPGAMDLSAHVARGGTWRVLLDLVPRWPEEALRTALLDAAGRPGGPRLARVLGETLPGRIVTAATRQAGIDEDNPALHSLDRKRRNLLVDALKGLAVPIDGVLGWDQAEVTAGGLALDAVDRTTMAVSGHPGLYVIGELLDLTGPIGGLNFQAAFSTGEVAARHAVATARAAGIP
ncbi:MAG: aminoacetone oxidase family FAD-binding enzyme [Deltaproteobacteria bacterium]|nr:aminoacetone oxidase family FAD-binding enzyme [Deltaproteobacteria bacterium]